MTRTKFQDNSSRQIDSPAGFSQSSLRGSNKFFQPELFRQTIIATINQWLIPDLSSLVAEYGPLPKLTDTTDYFDSEVRDMEKICILEHHDSCEINLPSTRENPFMFLKYPPGSNKQKIRPIIGIICELNENKIRWRLELVPHENTYQPWNRRLYIEDVNLLLDPKTCESTMPNMKDYLIFVAWCAERYGERKRKKL